jgi:hypothetical protein
MTGGRAAAILAVYQAGIDQGNVTSTIQPSCFRTTRMMVSLPS